MFRFENCFPKNPIEFQWQRLVISFVCYLWEMACWMLRASLTFQGVFVLVMAFPGMYWLFWACQGCSGIIHACPSLSVLVGNTSLEQSQILFCIASNFLILNSKLEKIFSTRKKYLIQKIFSIKINFFPLNIQNIFC